MNFGFDPLNIVLLAAAVIVFWRLRSVLGQRTGLERPAPDVLRRAPDPRPQAEAENVPLGVREEFDRKPVWEGYAAAGSPVAAGLEAIAGKSPGFDVSAFLKGAGLAYEMVLEAFAKGDKQALKPLLSREVFQGFSEAIDERARQRQDMTFQFVGIKRSRIESAELAGNRAMIGVQFHAEVIGATRDASGKILDGDEKQVRDLSDVWIFERDVTARDPNWKLVSTGENAA